MPKTELTVEELIATIQHSNCPTLIAEGHEDIIVLRKLEDRFSSHGLSVLPVGGRLAVLELFERRDEFPDGRVVLFIADKDVWVYGSIPNQFVNEKMIFTDGYSIENDMYCDGNLESLLQAHECTIFKSELDQFIKWYSVAISRHLLDSTVSISASPTHILDHVENLDEFINLQPGEIFPQAMFDAIKIDYAKKLRGKSLLALILRRLSATSRDPKHSGRSLIEYGCAGYGPCLGRIGTWLASHLNGQEAAPT